MNEKRAFYMLVGLGLFAITTNTLALIAPSFKPAPIAVNYQSQVAQVASTTTPPQVNFARNPTGLGFPRVFGQGLSTCNINKTAPTFSRCCVVTPVGNVCPGFSTSTATTYQPSWGKANDTNTNTIACSGRPFTGAPQSILVDLGSIKNIERIEIWQADINEAAKNCTFAGGYQLRIQNPITNVWEPVHTISSTSNKTINFTLPQVKQGQFVEFLVTKVLDNTGHRIGIKEFRVWGREADLMIGSLTRDASGFIVVEVKNVGGASVVTPAVGHPDVCVDIHGTTGLGEDMFNTGCATASQYPLNPGGSVYIKVPGDYVGEMHIGVNGWYYDIYNLSSRSYVVDPEFVKISEVVTNNNTLTVQAPPALSQSFVTTSSAPTPQKYKTINDYIVGRVSKNNLFTYKSASTTVVGDKVVTTFTGVSGAGIKSSGGSEEIICQFFDAVDLVCDATLTPEVVFSKAIWKAIKEQDNPFCQAIADGLEDVYAKGDVTINTTIKLPGPLPDIPGGTLHTNVWGQCASVVRGQLVPLPRPVRWLISGIQILFKVGKVKTIAYATLVEDLVTIIIEEIPKIGYP